MKFSADRVIITPAAQQALDAAGARIDQYLSRHYGGDWGTQDVEAWRMYDRALARGSFVCSTFELVRGVEIWIETMADRSATAIYLPGEN